jgi:hypothetical protein
MNMFATSQNQPRLSSITDVAPGGSANQIAVSAILNYLTMFINSVAVYLLSVTYQASLYRITCSKIEHIPLTYILFFIYY